MEKVRRQHYVPRMYLKRFGYGNIDDEYISVLKLDNGTVLDNRKVENFAVANYFYDADKEQIAEILKEDLKVFPELCDNEKLSDEQFTEHALAREESAISKMLNELQEDLSRIHISSNRNLMVIFLHSLAYRTKQFRDQMDAINNKTEKWLNSMCDNLGLDEETKKKIIETNCSTGKNTQLYQILGIKPVLETMQMLQYNYEWYEAVNNTELDFVISDNPAQTVRNTGNRGSSGNKQACMVTICHKYYHDSVFQKKTENKINTAMEQNLQKYIRHFTCLLHWNKKNKPL